MFLLFPLMLVYSLAVKNFLPMVKQRYAPAIIGLLVATLYSFIELLFFSAYYLSPYNFFSNYAYFLVFEVLVPCVLCFIILFIFIKKQENHFMLLYFILLGFYTVYFPARLMNRNTIFDWYLLLAKPTLYASMLYGIKNLIAYFYQYERTSATDENTGTRDKVFIRKFSLIFTACLAIPPAIDVMHLLVVSSWAIICVSILYIIATTYTTVLIDKDRFIAIISKFKEVFKLKNNIEQKEE